MLKDIIVKCAETLNRNDIIKSLKYVSSIDEITDEQIQSDVIKIISYYNYISNAVFQDYIELTKSETIKSDENNKIQYYNFSHCPIKILAVADASGSNNCANVFSGYILTNAANKEYVVTYKYLPPEVHDLTDEVLLDKKINRRIISFGIASEYYASKNLFTESEFWKSKFLYEIFKFKTHKERRLKSNFRL